MAGQDAQASTAYERAPEDFENARCRGLLGRGDGSDLHLTVPWYPCARRYSRRELLADATLHFSGSLFSALAAPALLWRSAAMGDEAAKSAGLAVYCVGLCAVLNFSSLFTCLAWKEPWFPYLQFLDMVGINLMIAGSYTPYCLQSQCLVMLCVVWVLAFFGIAWQVANFGIPAAKRYKVDVWIFLLMGWLVVGFGTEVCQYISPHAVKLSIAFGIIYSVGAGFNVLERLEFHKSIWHAAVLVATMITYHVCYYEFAGGLALGTRYEQ